jgi:cytochrome P450 family 103
MAVKAEEEANMSATASLVQRLPILTDEQLAADPHGVFRSWRQTHPVVAHEAGTYIILRFVDVDWIGKDARARATETRFAELRGVEEGALFDIFDQGMLTANDEAHRRRRSPFSRTFATRAIAALRPLIRQAAEELIDGWFAHGRVEFVDQFAAKLPALTISRLLGLPYEDVPGFTKLVYEVTKFVSLSVKPEETVQCEVAARQLRDYVCSTLNARRREPCGDFLSIFLAAADDAERLSPTEVIFQIVQLIIAATDTTRVAIAAQVALLLGHPPQWQEMLREPALIPGAVAEAMRFEPSVASISRTVAEDIDVSGVVVPAGSLMTLSTMSAMRDEDAYERPDVFDIHRSSHVKLHPIFGAGAHRCLGEALARAELEESLVALAARIPQAELEASPVLRGYTGIRRIDSMFLTWRT